MAHFKLMEHRVTRSIVLEHDDLVRLEELAASRRQSLSALLREAIDRYLADQPLPSRDADHSPSTSVARGGLPHGEN